MNWLQIAVNTTKNHAESTEDCLFSIGAHTVTLTDAANQPILEPAPDETPVWESVTLTGLFDFQDNQQSLLSSLEQCLKQHQTVTEFSCHGEILPDQNWTRAWMEHYHEMQFGSRLWVCPLHIEPPQADAVNLRLDPGLAFGTGTHPTTALCLRWLDQNIQQQTSVLDYGCGSGILAIAACMLGAAHADAVDIDPQALLATHSNAKVNQVNNKIITYRVDDYFAQHANTQYPLVLANILSGPLAELAPTLAQHTQANGDIVLSGILREQATPLIEIYCQYFDMDAPIFEEDWVLLHGTKKQREAFKLTASE